MIDLIYFSINLFLKYTVLYLFFYFSGRSSIILINKLYKKNEKIPSKILDIKSNILYPIIGTAIVGNLLIILNFLIPLKTQIVLFLLFFDNNKDAQCPYDHFPPIFAPRSLLCVRKRRFPFWKKKICFDSICD
mgnify:CR=1 FL=1